MPEQVQHRPCDTVGGVVDDQGDGLIHQLVVEVWHAEFTQASFSLNHILSAVILLQKKLHLGLGKVDWLTVGSRAPNLDQSVLTLFIGTYIIQLDHPTLHVDKVHGLAKSLGVMGWFLNAWVLTDVRRWNTIIGNGSSNESAKNSGCARGVQL